MERKTVTWLYTILAGRSVRVRYDLRQHEADWNTVEPYTEPPLVAQMSTQAQRRADKRYSDNARKHDQCKRKHAKGE